jgi:RimJ/RimL family protein N-acetyltransferase
MIDYGYEGIILTKDIDFKVAKDARNYPAIRDWCREYDEISEDDQEKWAKSLVDNHNTRMYSIKNKLVDKGKKQLGVCGLTGINMCHGTAEWSLYINPEDQGKGYATQALLTLLSHAFLSQNLNRVWGEIFITNVACMKLADRCSFKKEGTLRQTYYKNGKYIDSIIVSILKEEFINLINTPLEAEVPNENL